MRDPGRRRPEPIVRAGLDGGRRQDHRAMVRRSFGWIGRDEKANVGAAIKLPEPARVQSRCANRRHERSRRRHYRIIARGRSTASGPRRPICITGRSRRSHDMLLPQEERPKIFCVGNRQFDPVKVGLEYASGCNAGCASRHVPVRHVETRQQQPRTFFRRSRHKETTKLSERASSAPNSARPKGRR